MIVGCYSLDLYCRFTGIDNPADYRAESEELHGTREFPQNYTDEYGSVCRRNARKDGWKLLRDSTAICPKCVKAGIK